MWRTKANLKAKYDPTEFQGVQSVPNKVAIEGMSKEYSPVT